VSKSVGKFRKDENYSDDYISTKSRGDKDKKRSKYEEFKKVLSKEQIEFEEKLYMKKEYYDLD
jgi:hypothetical protein